MLSLIYLGKVGIGLFIPQRLCLCTPKGQEIITEENGKLTIV